MSAPAFSMTNCARKCTAILAFFCCFAAGQKAQAQIDAQSYYKEGIALRDEGKFEESNVQFRDAARIFYPNPEAVPRSSDDLKAAAMYLRCRTEIGRNYARMGATGQAVDTLQKVLQKALQLMDAQSSAVGRVYDGLAKAYEADGQPEQALRAYLKTLDVYRSILGDKHINIALIQYNVGVAYDNVAKYDSALYYKKRSLELQKLLTGERTLDVADAYKAIGVTLDSKGDFDDALIYYQKALPIMQEATGSKSPEVAEIYANMAVTYDKIGDKQNASRYNLKALSIREGAAPPAELAKSYLNLGNLKSEEGEMEAALAYFRKAETKQKEAGDMLGLASTYASIGAAYFKRKQYQKALSHYELALRTRKERLGDRHKDVAKSYNDMGAAFASLGNTNLDSALWAFQSAMIANTLKFDERSPAKNPEPDAIVLSYEELLKSLEGKAKAINNKVATMERKNSSISLDEWLKQSGKLALMQAEFKTYYLADEIIVKLRLQFAGKEKSLLDLGNQFFTIYERAIANALRLDNYGQSNKNGQPDYKAYAFMYAEQSKASILQQELGEGQAKRRKMTFTTPKDRVFMRKVSEEWAHTRKVISAQRARQDGPDQSVVQEQRDRQKELLAMKDSAVAVYLARYDSIRTMEKNFERDRALILKDLANESSKGARRDKDKIRNLQERLFSLEQQSARFQRQLEAAFPDFAKIRMTSTEDKAHPRKAQAILKKAEGEGKPAFLEYFVGKKNLYIFFISEDRYEVIEARGNAGSEASGVKIYPFERERLETAVPALRQGILKRDINAFFRASTALYQQLIEPVAGFLESEQIKRLFIVPDGLLSYIPFESLTSPDIKPEGDNWSELNYLVKHQDASYAYAYHLIKDEEAKYNYQRPGRELLAFAPVFRAEDQNRKFGGTIVSPLPGSEGEVQKIRQLFDSAASQPSQTYIADEAVKTRLTLENIPDEESVSNYRVVHFATHGFIYPDSRERSGLLLYPPEGEKDGMLYNGEINTLDLNAEIVVLSACETGLGKIVQGEGIMSITRNFIASGADRVVVSLWPVADASTSRLMYDFYRYNLQEKKKWPGALQAAKLDMINSGEFAAPYFWAPFVLIE